MNEILSQKQEKYALLYCVGMLSQMEVFSRPCSHRQYITQKCFYLRYVGSATAKDCHVVRAYLHRHHSHLSVCIYTPWLPEAMYLPWFIPAVSAGPWQGWVSSSPSFKQHLRLFSACSFCTWEAEVRE